MEDSQIILKLHEELLKTNRDLKYFKDECVRQFKRQRKINRFLICCIISLATKTVLKNIKNTSEKGTADSK